ncbi:MAG TPA: DUF559 domain-containing protein [Devosia sp.]
MVKHPPVDRTFARSMRTNATDAERRLWSMLRGGRLEGLKFKRQVPLDGYVLDFVCFEKRLIVEADGGQHSESVHDAQRDRHFATQGFTTLRFWNTDILTNPDGVWAEIRRVVKG